MNIRFLLAAAACVLTAPAMAASIVTNGGFETGDLTGWSGTLLASPYSGVICPGAGGAPENNCVLFAGTDGAAETLSQVLSTVVGQSYAVSFSFSSDGSSPSSFSAAFGNQGLYSVTSPALSAATTYTFTGTATGTSTALVFSFRNDPGYFMLDAVSVSAVPEPATAALAAAGLLGLLGWRRGPGARISPDRHS